ncbi:nicotinate-nucleotide--dimethylbenzimidazole phosphoribosyltransferase [Methylovirgula sp. 4M-Z18]|uniref:nicotinate-nucleotide--dimethylbenzimidazole phosphoribosyltransferase n=1 Tax=Methylovirgula sp. 4M-Z18 TaxID=2293567 RepID=UPI000E2F942E|nr:nicotinate-nucleotide--dimethylbenzimidazole phosphoribosyltransferase [Methylovirgula sp. 4M-Z18]RFB79884.1 nicotinate-nucleotide--dimethylbenzimidazole phosphoribosyltransferase [Methylovirgula sp. 4M-Z18]
MSASGLTFATLRSLLAKIPNADATAAGIVRERDQNLTKPPGSLGRLEQIAEWLAAWQGKARPTVDHPQTLVFAGNHGVTAKGVSPYPASVTGAMVANFAGGGAAINQICKTNGIALNVIDLSAQPTQDFTEVAAMSEAECCDAFATGMNALAKESDLLTLGEMGIGNTTAAAAIYYALFGGTAADWVGRGTGVDEAGLQRKIAAVEAAVTLHHAARQDPLAVLAALGGREIAAMAGAILAARLARVPVILDGYVVCAAAAVLHALDASALDHCIAGHVSAEGGHRKVLAIFGKKPLLDLDMRLGEGSGGALAVGIVKVAAACHTGMATFAEAGVANKE